MSVKKMVADMECDLRAARKYACLLFERLAMSTHLIDQSAKEALGRPKK